MTTPVLYQFQADFETPTYHVRDASTGRRPDAVSLDFLTAFCLGPAQIGDPITEGPEGRFWRARILTQGEIRLVRSTAAGDAWLTSEEYVVCTYAPSYPVEELSIGFTVFGQLVIAAQRATGPGSTPELWLASTNPYF